MTKARFNARRKVIQFRSRFRPGILLSGGRRPSVTSDLDHGLGEGLRRFLRRVMPDPAGEQTVGILAGKLLGIGGRVRMRLELVLRPDYGTITPWTELVPDGVMATAGADAFRLSTPLSLSLDELRARLVGMISTPATRIAQIVTAPASSLARVIGAYARKDEAA